MNGVLMAGDGKHYAIIDLTADLGSGSVIWFELLRALSPGVRVPRFHATAKLQGSSPFVGPRILENANTVVKMAGDLGLSTTNLSGLDLSRGSERAILALGTQLRRASEAGKLG